MTATDLREKATGRERFWHAAMFYSGMPEFLERTVPFLREGIEAGEPTLVVVDAAKIEALRDELGPDSRRIEFADMAFVGRNPARIIPAWQRFVDEHVGPDKPVRGIGEPIWAARSDAELIECQAHETLLNVAFDAGPPWSLLCPYDVTALGEDVLLEAQRSHPYLVHEGPAAHSGAYLTEHPSPARLDHPLADPPPDADQFSFGVEPESLRLVRRRVAEFATAAGMASVAVDRLTLAVSEVATNSIRHGGGRGILRLWSPGEAGAVICEISDAGHITGPSLLGRRSPALSQRGGRGLWLANQFCDLVQIRSGAETGTTVRLHVGIGSETA